MTSSTSRPPLSHLSVPAADGIAVAVHELGGRGFPVVFAHATGLHGLVWRSVASGLTDAFRIVAFDARGHGDSDVPPDLDFAWRRLALDALAVVDGLRLTSPYAVGHSSGATALLLAEQERPGTFEGLYCFEPILVAADPPLGRDAGNWLAAGARRRREVFSSRQEALANYASKAPFDRWTSEALADYVEHGFTDLDDGTVRLKCRGENEALVYEMASAHDGFSRLDEVRCPVLLACGRDSDAVGPTALAALAQRFPDARTEVLPDMAHFGPLENPSAVAQSIRNFLLACASPSTGGAAPPTGGT